MSRETEQISIFLTGLFIGGIIGGSLALLFTPVSGKKLRRKIAQSTDELMDDVTEYIETGKEKAEEIIKEGKRKAGSIMEDAKKIVSH